MVVQPVAGVVVQPIYLHVPPGHAKNWRKHCAHYNACGQPVYFENTSCVSCGMRLGFLPDRQLISALQESNGSWNALATARA